MPAGFSRRKFLQHNALSGFCFLSLSNSLLAVERKNQLSKPSKITVEDLVIELPKMIPKMMKKMDIPGLSISVIHNAKIFWESGFGVRNIITREPVTNNTVFEAASLSKPVFAYAVLQLCDRGLLKLDTPLTEYLNEPFIQNETRMKQITARMVLSHTSGLPHGRKENELLVLSHNPGKQFLYSATGFDYLQSVVKHLTGQPLAEMIKQNVLDPIGMSQSNFGWKDIYETQRALGYDQNGKLGETFNERYRTATNERKEAIKTLFPELSYPSAAAGMYSTATDFAKFMIEILSTDIKSNGHLSETMLNEMLKSQIKVNQSVSWGLGWGLQHSKREDLFWHWGNWSGLFQHIALGFKHDKSGVVIMTNSGNGLKLCQELLPKIVDIDIKPLRGFLN